MIAATLVIVLVLVVVVARFLNPPSSGPKTGPIAADCPAATSVLVGTISVPAGPIAGYCQANLQNAAEIIRAARALGISTRGQQIGVMTAIGESGLRNVNFGDKAGPDSRGLFQQRANWGPLAARMDPYTAATAFYKRMLGVAHWNRRAATDVAHTVQGNANPQYYSQFEIRAGIIVKALNARSGVWPYQ